MNYIRLVHRLRTSPLIWEDDSHKIHRILLEAKNRKIKQQQEEESKRVKVVGPYSGLTREELRRTGTCEPDWF